MEVPSGEVASSASSATASLPQSAPAAATQPPTEGSFSREVFLFTTSGGIFFVLAALTKVITNGWPPVARTLFALFTVCVVIFLAAGSVATTTMSDRPKLHFLAKVAARVSLIIAIMILEIPFIQMATGLSALVFAPILMIATLIILGYIWWWSEPDIVCACFCRICRSRGQVQVNPEPAEDNV
ncbi:Os07g0173601 [Oryza sativa Japonica Group]|uniref:Os07g0173601 protein n=1 Tax=Oryza sativa subsp. japonica TaxID=39947 RepID=A0A0P0X2P0_ORYSJ|nr:Os07g0173601 [Oryza sativa Japonica Group]